MQLLRMQSACCSHWATSGRARPKFRDSGRFRPNLGRRICEPRASQVQLWGDFDPQRPTWPGGSRTWTDFDRMMAERATTFGQIRPGTEDSGRLLALLAPVRRRVAAGGYPDF